MVARHLRSVYFCDVPASPTLVTSRRYDRGGELLRAHRRASDGVLLAECIPSREGILEYVRADGSIRRELVTREALLDTARTAPRSAMTLEHPREGFITADSFAKLGVGDVDGSGTVEEDAQGGFVKLKIAVRRRDALDAIGSGTHEELSLGYDATCDETPGEHPVFGRYDARQIARDCNHLALVPKGRAVTTLRVDSTDAYQRPPVATNSREDHMNPSLLALLAALGVTRVDSEGAGLTAGLAAAEQLKSDAAKRKDAEEAAATGATEMETLKAQVTALNAKVTALEQAAVAKQGEMDAVTAENAAMKADAQAKRDAAELARLQTIAGTVGVKHDGLDLPKLRVAIAKTRVDSIDDKSPAAYVDGVLATIEKSGARRDSRFDFSPPTKDGTHADAADPAGGRRDPFYNPTLAHLDEMRNPTPAASRSN